jgi:hypothetical protein
MHSSLHVLTMAIRRWQQRCGSHVESAGGRVVSGAGLLRFSHETKIRAERRANFCIHQALILIVGRTSHVALCVKQGAISVAASPRRQGTPAAGTVPGACDGLTAPAVDVTHR